MEISNEKSVDIKIEKPLEEKYLSPAKKDVDLVLEIAASSVIKEEASSRVLTPEKLLNID